MNPKIALQIETLEKAVRAITDSKEYRKYLSVMSRFPTYSIRNTLLIYAQKPDATHVAGYQSWQRLFGRHVKKGEKGIRILAPYTWKEDVQEGHETRQITRTGFHAIPVFDLSQTEGEPLPEPPKAEKLSGSFALLHEKKHQLEELCGYSICFDHLEDGASGLCRHSEKKILLEESLEEAHAFKTMLHECAHALLHGNLNPDDPFENLLLLRQPLREVEAESVSYVVCSQIGLDCSEYSFGYIAGWKEQEDFLQESLTRIGQASELLLSLLKPEAPAPFLPAAKPPVPAGI